MKILMLLASFIMLAQSGIAEADPVLCGAVDVTVTADDASIANAVCSVSERAMFQFRACNLGPFPEPLRVDIVGSLSANCVGLYHCNQNWVELLEPSSMQALRQGDGVFGFLTEEEYFRSIVVHELAHAAFDAVPCPYEGCVVANEYIAYAMQVMSLSPDYRKLFEERSGLDRRVSVVEFSRLMLDLAPERFGARAWAHLQQRDDPCGYIGAIVNGSVLLDHER